jgi:hypothetical protein
MKKHLLSLLSSGLLLGAVSAQGAIVMLDFGSDGAYTGNDSPAHTEGAIASSYTTWTQVGGGNTTVTDSASNSLFYASARSDSGGESDGGFFNFDRAGAVSNPGGGTGIWGTSLTGSYMADITSANRRDPVAIALEGFATGEYHVFVVAHSSANTNISLNVNVGVAASIPGSGDMSLGGLSGTTVTLGGGGTSWIAGTNYAKYTVTLSGSNDTILVAVENLDNSGTGENFQGTLSALQIVPVPEPSTYALAFGALALGGVMLRRRRKA